MPSTLALIATALLALCIGLAGGWMLGLRQRSKRDVILDLEARLEKALEGRADYEAEVAEHFATTAQLLNRLTEDYRAVYGYLAEGARELCDGDVDIALPGNMANDDAELPAASGDTMQPLDYAPRRSPDEQGQLSEAFGLERETVVVPPIFDNVANGR